MAASQMYSRRWPKKINEKFVKFVECMFNYFFGSPTWCITELASFCAGGSGCRLSARDPAQAFGPRRGSAGAERPDQRSQHENRLRDHPEPQRHRPRRSQGGTLGLGGSDWHFFLIFFYFICFVTTFSIFMFLFIIPVESSLEDIFKDNPWSAFT